MATRKTATTPRSAAKKTSASKTKSSPVAKKSTAVKAKPKPKAGAKTVMAKRVGVAKKAVAKKSVAKKTVAAKKPLAKAALKKVVAKKSTGLKSGLKGKPPIPGPGEGKKKKKLAAPAPVLDANGRLRQTVLKALDDLKAKDIKELDVRGKTSIADLIIVASGTSTRHVKSIADEVVKSVKAAGSMPRGVEGMREAEWVLVDVGDLVVHIMLPRVREFYALERLWTVGDADPHHTLMA